MTTRTITIEHEGETYSGQIATIESTSLGFEDHGILTAMLHCSWQGGGVGVGGFCLDQPKDKNSRDYSRAGTAYGLDHIIRLIETVGVGSWEKLTGREVIVLFKGKSMLGATAAGIAGVTNDKVLILADHAAAWKDAVNA